MINVYQKAAEEVEARGWCQGRYVDLETGAVCAVGALNVAISGDPMWVQNHFETGRLQIILHGRGWNSNVQLWNDDSSTTKEDVLDLLREAAAQVEAETVDAELAELTPADVAVTV